MPKTEKPGPKADHLKVEGDWEDAIHKALEKKRPEKGWPDHKDEKSHSEPDSGEVESD